MSQKQSIRFRIKQDGTVEEVVSGVCGSTCKTLTKRIEEKLGIISYSEVTSEYYKNEQVVETEHPLTKWR
jgi:adenylate kinase